jgi:glycosyltransferase involved in cell wall biosynthesis
MRKKLEAKHNTAHVIFTGVQTGEQLAQHYASGDIFLFPSTTDTFGNVVTEAMASGLCIVAYNDAAPRELLDNMRSGLLCDLGDEAAFIENAVLGYENPNLLKNISAASLNIAQTLTWDEITEQLIMSLYQKKQVDGGHHERKQDPEFISSANQT